MMDMTEEVKSAFDDVFGLCFKLADRVKALEEGRPNIEGEQTATTDCHVEDAITDRRAGDTIQPFTVFVGGKQVPPQGHGSQAHPLRSDQALGRWKDFSMKVTPQLAEFIERYAKSEPYGYLRSDVLHDAMIALCEKQGIEIDWRRAIEEGPLVMGTDDEPDEPCPDPVSD